MAAEGASSIPGAGFDVNDGSSEIFESRAGAAAAADPLADPGAAASGAGALAGAAVPAMGAGGFSVGAKVGVRCAGGRAAAMPVAGLAGAAETDSKAIPGMEDAVASGTGAGFCGAIVAPAAADFASSFFFNRPRATRRVPLACSIFTGLVKTRFAPSRNALATPACPSTTATASAVWLLADPRALLNSSAAFCSLSQSTTTASKRSAISRLTAANGSAQGTTANSNSLNTWVTVEAIFSSGQKRRA